MGPKICDPFLGQGQELRGVLCFVDIPGIHFMCLNSWSCTQNGLRPSLFWSVALDLLDKSLMRPFKLQIPNLGEKFWMGLRSNLCFWSFVLHMLSLFQHENM